MRRLLPLLAACALLAGCGTPAYRAARDACEQRYLLSIPPDYETVRVLRYRHEKVKDKRCTVLPDGNQSCSTTYRTDYVPRYEYERVDRNAERREDAIGACVRNACMESHGNPDCKQ